MTPAARIFSLIALVAAVPVGAVGLGPLRDEGVIDGPRKGFNLTLYNPYKETTAFRTYAVGPEDGDETPQMRVTILPNEASLGSLQTRRILVIANDLQPGETYRFRLCAERVAQSTGVMINARVCSKLSARRVG